MPRVAGGFTLCENVDHYLNGLGEWSVPAGGGGASAPALVVPILNQLAAAAWTNMPVAETFFAGSHRHATQVDLTDFTQVRLVVNKQATAGAANSIIFAKYRATFDATVGNWSAIGTSAVSVAVNVQNTVLASAWVDLAAGARADVLVCCAGASGDGVLDPQFGAISLQFR